MEFHLSHWKWIITLLIGKKHQKIRTANLILKHSKRSIHNLLDINLKALLSGDKVRLPKYNFKTGKSGFGEEIQLNENQVIIIEGIHGLNPTLIADLNRKNTFRIYVSCLTQLNLDYYNRISTTDTRMLRRIVRDANSRGFGAQRTIELWESVRRGEREYIFPYQENADEIFNSALVYELSALKPLVEPLLRQIAFGSEGYLEAKRLLAFPGMVLADQ